MRLCAALCVFLSQFTAFAIELNSALRRLAEEAAVFSRLAPQAVSEETLLQRVRNKPSRFQPRQGPAPDSGFRSRRIVSEYGYTTFEDSPGVLHELRRVIEVDGHPVRTKLDARTSLSLGMASRDDRVKRRMLREFEQYGLGSAVVDLGQLILLFEQHRQSDYQFHYLATGSLGGVPVTIFTFNQVGGAGAVTVFQGRTLRRNLLEGEIWSREPDGLPLRIVLRTSYDSDRGSASSEAITNYAMSSHGVLLPVTIVHREYVNDELQVENIYIYKPFRRFAADSSIRFEGEKPAGKAP